MKNDKKKYTTVRDLMRLLVSIDQNGCRSAREIAEGLGMTHVTVTRLIYRLRVQYHIVIQRAVGPHKEYTILDWGFLDRERVYAYVNDDEKADQKSPQRAEP